MTPTKQSECCKDCEEWISFGYQGIINNIPSGYTCKNKDCPCHTPVTPEPEIKINFRGTCYCTSTACDEDHEAYSLKLVKQIVTQSRHELIEEICKILDEIPVCSDRITKCGCSSEGEHEIKSATYNAITSIKKHAIH